MFAGLGVSTADAFGVDWLCLRFGCVGSWLFWFCCLPLGFAGLVGVSCLDLCYIV